jgi:myo-inositol-1(or 4)-monophosphatase
MYGKHTAISEQELQSLFKTFRKPVLEAGAFIRSSYGQVADSHIEVKAQNSLVSFVDKEAEDLLVTALSDLMPEAGFITEEDTIQNYEKDLTWIIDPLDGTTNFLQGIPVFAVSVALYGGDEPLLGAVYDIMHDELFTAMRGGGCFLNEKRLGVSKTSRLSDAVVATGFPYNTLEKIPDLLQWFSRFLEHARGLRRLGSAALDLAYVSCGRFDGFYESSLNPWDVAAGALLVTEAGGKVTDFFGGTEYLHRAMIIASNGLIHEEMMPLLTDRA